MATVRKPAAGVAATKQAKEKKARTPIVPKEKKPIGGSKPSSPSHPTYFQMIKEAIVALKEKSGSSPHAIAKHMVEKHKAFLPVNYKKMLTVQLRNCVASGKLIKVKGSFKLSDASKKGAVKKPALAVKEKNPKALPSGSAKAKAIAADDAKKKKRKADGAVSKPKSKPAAKTRLVRFVASPANKKSKKATPAKPKQPKSIKSPVSKRARKVTA